MNPGIKVVGPTLLVIPEAVEEVTKSGIILSTLSQREKEQMAQSEGVVVQIGHLCWKDQLDVTPWCNVGDRILFSKFAGYIRQGQDGKEYRIISDLDVKAIIDKE